MINKRDLDRWFRYHSPRPDQVAKYGAIRDQALSLAMVVLEQTPPSAEQAEAILMIRRAVMFATAAIACNSG